MTQAKAVGAAILAVLVTLGANLEASHQFTTRGVIVALIAALAAHQGAYWPTNYTGTRRNRSPGG